MCKAFSAIVLKSGDVLWQMGIDSHDSLIASKPELKDIDAIPSFARIEITPKNGDYLFPDEWIFHLDEKITPTWWTKGYEQFAWDAQKEWLGKLDKILIRKKVIHPFKDIEPPKKILKKHLKLLKKHSSVYASVCDSVYASVYASVCDYSVYASVYASVCDSVFDSVCDSVCDYSVYASVYASVYSSVYAYLGSFFNLPRESWKHTRKIKTKGYPFQPAVDLWEMGLVPSFDGEKWRLHEGRDAKVLWEGEI